MPTTRRKGAQPGNANALKHGFYSRQFRRVELADLQVLTATLEDEIASLRIASRRMLEQSDNIEDPERAIQALNLFGNQMMKVARMIQIQANLIDKDSDSPSLAFQAITEVLKEKKLL